MATTAGNIFCPFNITAVLKWFLGDLHPAKAHHAWLILSVPILTLLVVGSSLEWFQSCGFFPVLTSLCSCPDTFSFFNLISAKCTVFLWVNLALFPGSPRTSNTTKSC